ncbi:MAG TPA: DEAD/DEAH box helicase family protein [Candidatus Dojkabacteria bacterium]|jgi:excinuclease ABC subunit B
MADFKLHSKFKPTGDQPKAIDALTNGVLAGIKEQTLLGVTGSGKTFTMANVIKNLGTPALIISHNKTLAAQLFSEFREFFPENSVEYFVSYYDYYQPEAYVAKRDLYIEKEADINETIERYRSAASQAILSRKDVIIIASVSCIYGIGNPEDYLALTRDVAVGETYEREKLLVHLHDLQYERSDYDFSYGMYRVRGDILDINDAVEDYSIRIEFFGDEIESIKAINSLTGEVLSNLKNYRIFPAKQFVTPFEKLRNAIGRIKNDLELEVEAFKKQGKLIEAERLRQRVNYDVEMLQEVGYCSGIENYSRYIDNREPGSPPSSLLDYFPKDWLLIVDESHITIPQVRGMYEGDKARKQSLVDYGFRLKAARDNRPLKYEEFRKKIANTIYVSATPSEYEIQNSNIAANKVREKKPELFAG